MIQILTAFAAGIAFVAGAAVMIYIAAYCHNLRDQKKVDARADAKRDVMENDLRIFWNRANEHGRRQAEALERSAVADERSAKANQDAVDTNRDMLELTKFMVRGQMMKNRNDQMAATAQPPTQPDAAPKQTP